MSKVKKKSPRLDGSLSEEDLIFEKIIYFSGWIFLLILLVFLGAFLGLDFIFGLIELQLNAPSFSVIIFTGTNCAISFALATRIKKNRDQKKKLFVDWLKGEFLFCVIAILVVAIYQW
ncbi:MAG TPA: hypothetical protein VMV43_02390 [Candidatus Nanopelagicaceae bacterium]|jgi:hypothetical protein|nr:hypothetical protein [Candidatus Nanopelagicaceae bacterium]